MCIRDRHNTYDVELYGPNPLCGIWSRLSIFRSSVVPLLGAPTIKIGKSNPGSSAFPRILDEGKRSLLLLVIVVHSSAMVKRSSRLRSEISGVGSGRRGKS